MGIDDDLPDAHLFRIKSGPTDLVEIAQFLQEGKTPKGNFEKKKKILAMKVTPFTLINGSLYKLGLDDVLHWCVLEHERQDIIKEAHPRAIGGHF